MSGNNIKPITPGQLKCLNTVISKQGIDKERKAAMVLGFSGERSQSSKDLNFEEATAMIKHLKELDPHKAAAEKMRNKILYYAHEMGWHQNGTDKIDMQSINAWCLKYGSPKRELDKYSYEELPILVSQFEAVYKSFIKGF